MKIRQEIITNFLKYECDTKNKVLLNICDTIEYGVTDSNLFYSRFYNKIENDFRKCTKDHTFGDICFCDIFSYHVICNMFCVKWPKSQYNITPFKYNYFEKCCVKLCKHIVDNNIDTILTPVFGTEILQGKWDSIMQIMNLIFPENCQLIVFK